MADKAYSAAAVRAWLRRRHVKAVIPAKEDQAARRRGRVGGRPFAFDAEVYKTTQHRRLDSLRSKEA